MDTCRADSDAVRGWWSPGASLPPMPAPVEPVLTPIWQWPRSWQCPMLGVGLSIGEQRRIFKRPPKTRRMDAYGLHQALMTVVGDENQISRRIDRFLQRHYRRLARLGLSGRRDAAARSSRHCQLTTARGTPP